MLLAPLALFIGPARHEWRRWLLIPSPMLLLSLPPPLLTMPCRSTSLAWLGAWATLWLLLVGWTLTVLPAEIRSRARAWRERGGVGLDTRRLLRSPAPWLAVALVIVVSVFADIVGPRSAEAVTSEDLWHDHASALRTPARDDAFARWQFVGAVAPDWTPIEGVATQTAEGALELTTTTGRSEYQLTGPRVLLSPGAYELRADVTVGEGGLDLGVLNADADTWLGNAHYWYGQPGFGSHDLIVPFELTKPLLVRPILSNWRFQTGWSWWSVRQIWIRRA